MSIKGQTLVPMVIEQTARVMSGPMIYTQGY